MGLLDDAIREHLELKRRSGADPSAVARDEREALAPVLADAPADEHVADPPEELDVPETETVEVVSARPAHHHGERLGGLSTIGQETAELDMQAVMEEDPDAADSASPLGPIVDGPTPPAYSGQLPVEDGPGWELPSERDREQAPADIPGQERLTFE
jgi:hypothetical protein